MDRRVRVGLILCSALLGCQALAQTSLVPKLKREPQVPASLASPRATMRTFIEGMKEARISEAVSTLDLSAINPLERAERGPQLAFQLWAILNREVYIQYRDLADTPDAPTFSLPITNSAGTEVGEVEIDRASDGAYLFTQQSLGDLQRLWPLVREKPVIQGLSDPSLRRFDPAGWLESRMPASAHREIVGIPLWKLVFLALMVLSAAIVSWIVRNLTEFFARRALKLTKSDEACREIHRGGFALGLLLLASMVARNYIYLGLPAWLSGFIGFASRMGQIAGAVLLAFAVWDGIVQAFARRDSESAQRLVAPVVSRLGKAVIVVVAAVMVLTLLGVNVAGLVATLGIGGLVIALAAKDSVENLFGSIMVLIEKPFRIGDWIRIGDVDGEVEEIRLRSTRIRTFEDSVIVLPNSALVTKSVENFGMRRFRRLKTTISIANHTPPAKVEEYTSRLRAQIAANPNVWEERQHIYFNDFGDSALAILLGCYIIAPTRQRELEIRDEILLQALKLADEVGVELAHRGPAPRPGESVGMKS